MPRNPKYILTTTRSTPISIRSVPTQASGIKGVRNVVVPAVTSFPMGESMKIAVPGSTGTKLVTINGRNSCILGPASQILQNTNGKVLASLMSQTPEKLTTTSPCTLTIDLTASNCGTGGFKSPLDRRTVDPPNMKQKGIDWSNILVEKDEITIESDMFFNQLNKKSKRKNSACKTTASTGNSYKPKSTLSIKSNTSSSARCNGKDDFDCPSGNSEHKNTGRNMSDASNDIIIIDCPSGNSEHKNTGRNMSDASNDIIIIDCPSGNSEHKNTGRKMSDASDDIIIIDCPSGNSEHKNTGRKMSDASDDIIIIDSDTPESPDSVYFISENDDIVGQDELISILEAHLPGQDELLSLLGAHLPGQDEQLANFEAHLPGQNEQLANFEAHLPGQDEQLANFEAHLPGQDEQLANFEAHLPGQDEQLANFEAHLPGQDEQLANFEAHLPEEDELLSILEAHLPGSLYNKPVEKNPDFGKIEDEGQTTRSAPPSVRGAAPTTTTTTVFTSGNEVAMKRQADFQTRSSKPVDQSKRRRTCTTVKLSDRPSASTKRRRGTSSNHPCKCRIHSDTLALRASLIALRASLEAETLLTSKKIHQTKLDSQKTI